MNTSPSVLLIDDGELADARELLDQLNIEYEEIRGSKHRGPLPDASQLLITTSKHAISLGCRRGPGRGQRAVWIAFLAGESKTQRQVLERAGFDFMVRQPVHPAALRLLLQRALYQGEESRSSGRVAFGYGVTFKMGMRSHKGTLTDLSPTGAQLMTSRDLGKRDALVVRIPAEAAGGKRLDLPASVVRSQSQPHGDGIHVYGLRFNRLPAAVRTHLRKILDDHAKGPAVLSAPVAVPKSSKALLAKNFTESREHPRKSYAANVTAIGGNSRAEVHHVLLGRDLSRGGMRVGPEPSISLDDQLQLAIQSPGSGDAILVKGTVLRDDGKEGLAVRFDWIDPETEPELGELVDSLPTIEELSGPKSSAGRVLTQLISSIRRR